ncbi:MAG TPA: ABC transporter substrate-binding protein [Acidimicrobiia bacterium]|nr:ABC transporter substrate-binding protein [Acidimicrobiia bacterium]
MRAKTRRATVALIFVLAACSSGGGETTTTADAGGSTSTTAAGATGGTVRVGYAGAPADLNPGLGVLVEDYIMYDLIYDSLADLDLEGNFQPEIATDWSVSDDGLTWTINIRDDVVFHDGTPLTAEDVAYTLNLYRDTEGFVYLPSYLTPFTAIEAVDATTVTMTTEAPLAAFDYRLSAMFILPRHIWEAAGDVTTFTNDEMIGSGPFTLAEHSQDEFVRLAANESYWDGRPNVDEVIFQSFTNPDARVQALINGDIDMIYEFPATAVPALQGTANVEVVDGLEFGGRLADIFFNMIDPENCPADVGICSGHPALRDVVVRRALAHAVDKQQLIDTLLLGLGEPGLGLVPPALGDWFASELVPEDYAFDLALAAQMLEDAGYVDTDGDGIRECPTDDCGPTGDLTFRLNYPTDNDEHPRVADTLSGWWAEIGVAVQIQGLDADALTSVCCPSFDYDVMLWSWTSDTDPESLMFVLLCSEIDTGNSETGYCNPAYDELNDRQTVETDPAARREMIVEMQRITLEDVPYIIPWYYPKVQAFRTDTFTGWQTGFPIVALEDESSLTVVQPAG